MSNFRRQTDTLTLRQSTANVSLTEAQFTWLRDRLAVYSGVYLDAARQRVLEVGIAQRLTIIGGSLADYERRLRLPQGRDELRQLAELIVNHETFFFRNKAHIRALTEVLLPELHARKPPGVPIRIWSAGCATGEEAYSLAINAREALGQLPRSVEIWATDLSGAAIERARLGYYQGRALAQVPPELLARYFVPSGNGYTVVDSLRHMVRFAVLNLLEPFPSAARNVDIIFCQNVLIYFQLATCQTLLERFYACLPDGGLLCLGFSETLWNRFHGFRVREVAGSYVYWKEAVRSAPTGNRRAVEQRYTPTTQLTTNRSTGRVTKRAASTLDSIPGSAEATDATALKRARAFLDAGETEQALNALQRISPRSPQAAQALTLAARIHADRGDLDLAEAEAQRALEIDALYEEAYTLLGLINGRQGDWVAAAQRFERARYLNPDAALVSFHLAESLRQLGQAEAAAREYRTTLRKLDAHPPDALLDGVAVGWLRATCQRYIGQ